MLEKLKCNIGWHDWENETETDEITSTYKQRCKQCGKEEVINIVPNIPIIIYVTQEEFEERMESVWRAITSHQQKLDDLNK